MFLKALGFLFCDVLIIGGGPAGLHTAYQLSKINIPKICLIEKENRLGGRFYDAPLDPKHPELVYGLGALRIMENQKYVLNLAKELEIPLEFAPYQDDLISSRGFFSFNSDELNQLAYPLLSKEYIDSSGFGTENTFYQKLLHGPKRQKANSYPNLASYVQDTLGTQAYHFLPEVYRFKAEFQIPIDPRSYLDYLEEEIVTCCNPYYPVGGMSAFTEKMAALAQKKGVQIFKSEPALELSKKNNLYQTKTPHYLFESKKLIIATDANSFKSIQGEIAQKIQSQKQFQDIFGVKISTVSQRWPEDWWLDSGYNQKNVRRAWTTEHCLSFIEIPINPYATQQHVTRSVYNDDIACSEFWENTYSRLGIKAVEDEVERGLNYLFPKAHIPKPLNTVVQIWPTAWYYLKSGTQFTNKQIAEWALEPIPGEQVYLVGDSYWIQRAGWSISAYFSSNNMLNKHFGLHLNTGSET